jgi:lipopolysaccharide/colanic/teichoic acid biosynthesis glycosyltransferase
MKRLFDIVVALIALVFLSPLLITVVLLIKLESHGPVFFIQDRVGLNCKIFSIYRSTSIDELPQLFNVLLGDMSIVGPRPDLELQRNNYQPEEWQIRHIVRPGITGLAQVNGRSNISLQDRIEYDIKYVRTHDFWLDFKIILRTFAVVFFGRNTN